MNAATLTADQWKALTPQVDAASISVTINSPPVVTFKVTDAAGTPIVGLGAGKTTSSSTTLTSYNNIAFTLAKLVPGVSTTVTVGGVTTTSYTPSKWVSYIVTRPTSATAFVGTYPTTDKEGTLVDNGDGTYQYTFFRDVKGVAGVVAGLTDDATHTKADLGDTAFDATLTHRLGIMIYGDQPGTNKNTPTGATGAPQVAMVSTLNAYKDFRPDGGALATQRTVVVKDSCSSCHDGKGIGHVSQIGSDYIGRNDPNFCVTCHTDQTKYSLYNGNPDPSTGIFTYKRTADNLSSAFDYPRMIHQTHMGEELTRQGYNLNGHWNASSPMLHRAQLLNTVGFPQDIRNCTTCHDNAKAAQADNWKTTPSRLACGACHDGINFADGTGTTVAGLTTGHEGGPQPDDTLCAVCHTATNVPIYHQTTVPSTHNPTVQAGATTFQYKISSTTINASKQLVVKFQILMNGTPTTLNTAPATTPLTGFTSGPTFMVIYATAQDGIAAPSDWNSKHDSLSLLDAINGTNGNVLAVADAATNTYQVTIVQSTGSSHHTLALPDDAKMVTVFLKDSFVDPTVTERGGTLPGLPAMMAATGNTPDGQPNVARRVIFSETKCNACHDRLGTSPNFHNGNYSIAMCAACHTPIQGGSTGWSASFRVWVHGIHSAEKREVPFTWHAVSATDNYSFLQYPGKLKDCQQCHLPGTYDFSASQYTDALIGSMLNVQDATGTGILSTSFVPPQAAPVGSGNLAYGLASGMDYGSGWSIDTSTGKLAAATTQGNNLVSSPITAVCSTCHDSSSAISHMLGNGGSFYTPRSTAVNSIESCLICHGKGRIAAIADVHAQ